MEQALEGSPDIPFRIPGGVRLVRIDASTGQLASDLSKKVILEAFLPGTEPTVTEVAAPGLQTGGPFMNRTTTGSGIGGLY